MASPVYYERIDSIFEELEDRLDMLDEDPDVAAAAGVINVTFRSGVVFVFSRQPPTEQLWLATPRRWVAFTTSGVGTLTTGWIRGRARHFDHF